METKQSDLFRRGWAMQTKLHAEWNSAVQNALSVVRRLPNANRQTFLTSALHGGADTLEPWGLLTSAREQELVATFSTSFVLRENSALMQDVGGGPSGTLSLARELFWLYIRSVLETEGELPNPSETDRAYEAVQRIESLLYPGGDMNHQWDVDDLDEIATILEACGFGRAAKGG